MKSMQPGDIYTDSNGIKWVKINMENINSEATHYFVRIDSGQVRHYSAIVD